MPLTATLIATLLLKAGPYNPTGPKITFMLEGGKSFVIATDPKGSPKTTAQIVSLVKSKFYDGQRIHRVEDWVIQWGDPKSKKSVDEPGVGSGGSNKALPFEDNPASFSRGVVGIASTGKKVGGDSQLFVVKRDSTFLDHDYAIVGKVVSGMDVLDKATRGAKIVKATVGGGVSKPGMKKGKGHR